MDDLWTYWVDPVNQAFTPAHPMYDGVLAMWDDPTMAVTPEYAAHSTYLPKARASIERRMTERPDRVPDRDPAILPDLNPHRP